METIRPVAPAIENYMGKLLGKHDEQILLEMEELAREKRFPIVGRAVGAFLEVLTLSIRAKKIFELGSGYGYSAYWFSRAVGEDGKVICTDGDQQNIDRAKEYFQRLNRLEQVEFHTGWAQEIFRQNSEEFDIIYNDVDKIDYPEVWNLVKGQVGKGGFYIADNVLWSGRVTWDEIHEDLVPGWTEAIQKHNELIANDPDFDFFINPTRDGVIVARRKD